MSERILIVRMSALGDVIQSTPVARALKTALPDCHLTWLVQRPFAPVLEHNPHIDELFVVPMRPGLTQLLGAWRRLRRGDFSTAIDLQGLFKSALPTWISAAPRRIGKEEAREAARFAYTELSPERWDQRYISQRYLEQCLPLGVSRDDFVPEVFLTDADFGPADDLWAAENLEDAHLVVVMPTFSAEPRREWPEDHFVQLGDRLTRTRDARIIIPGTARERERAQALAERMSTPAIVFAGRTSVREAAALLRRADLVIGADSGLTHLAWAVGTPVVCILGPSPIRNGPTGDIARTVFIEDMPCRPCRPSRPCDHHRCMMEITPEMVAAAAEDLAHTTGLL